MNEKIILIQIAALGYNFLVKNLKQEKLGLMEIKPLKGLFPALTCTVQATLRTAVLPSVHGIVGNGYFENKLLKPMFWEQSSRLIDGSRIWDNFRSRGGKVAQMFIQQSLGMDSDIFFSPAPVHKHHGGMILDCMSNPVSLNERLKKEIGSDFPLHSYWGPFASRKSGDWIIKAVKNVMLNEKPGFLFTYIPHLDYDLQRFGPDSKEALVALNIVMEYLEVLFTVAKEQGYKVLVFGDYSITPASHVIFPNKLLRAEGLLKTRNVRGMMYPNYYISPAFAAADHQIAHVYVFDPDKLSQVRALFEKMEGVDQVIDGKSGNSGIENKRSGEIVLIAKRGCWFDYRWWDDKKEAPEYASHVDIHNKPGYDPCELLKGRNPFKIRQDPGLIKGTHGRVDEDEPVFYASDIYLGNPESILELSRSIKNILESRGGN